MVIIGHCVLILVKRYFCFLLLHYGENYVSVRCQLMLKRQLTCVTASCTERGLLLLKEHSLLLKEHSFLCTSQQNSQLNRF